MLEVVSSEFLYKTFPRLPEGEMTKKRASLVCEPALAFCAREIDLGSFLLLGKGEEATGGRHRDSIVFGCYGGNDRCDFPGRRL